jgi:hypothetical protein
VEGAREEGPSGVQCSIALEIHYPERPIDVGDPSMAPTTPSGQGLRRSTLAKASCMKVSSGNNAT